MTHVSDTYKWWICESDDDTGGCAWFLKRNSCIVRRITWLCRDGSNFISKVLQKSINLQTYNPTNLYFLDLMISINLFEFFVFACMVVIVLTWCDPKMCHSLLDTVFVSPGLKVYDSSGTLNMAYVQTTLEIDGYIRQIEHLLPPSVIIPVSINHLIYQFFNPVCII